jgi:hypothetical protein
MNFFLANGFQVIRQIIEPVEYFEHLRELELQGKLTAEGVNGPYHIYKDSKFEALLESLTPVIEEYCECKLYKTYSFGRVYNPGDILKTHTDREACEITVTINLGFTDSPWPLGIMNRDEQPNSILLEPGDALIFKGIELAHWRERNVYGKCSQLFLHYVDQDGEFAAYRDDCTPEKIKESRLKRLFRRRIHQPS